MQYKLKLGTPVEYETIEAESYEDAIKQSGEIARDYLSALSSYESYEIEEVKN